MKAFKLYIVVLFSAFYSLMPDTASAQFYNGLQMSFGKNRIQYLYRYWNYYRFKKYDTYFYGNTQDLPEFVARTADKKLQELETFYGHTLDRRIIFIIYDNIGAFRESNIGLITGNDDYNIGGVNKIIDNKVFLYYEGDHNKFETQISKTISDLLYHEVESGNSFRDKVASQGNKNIPAWYSKGIVSYSAEKWNVELDNKLKDGILNKKFKRINLLTDDEAELVGHSLWRFIAQKFGDAVIPNIIYMAKINRNIDEGFLFTLGYPLRDLVDEWYETTKKRYETESEARTMPESGKLIKRPRPERVYQQVKISPDAKNIVYSMNHKGKYKIYLYNKTTGKRKKIFVHGHKLEQITDYAYPVIAWHPSGKSFSFFSEEKGEIRFNTYNLDRKELKSRLMLYFDQVLSFGYSDDGGRLVISGVKEGRTDIYIHNLASGFNQRITNDWADDLEPRFANKSKEIIFSSNRTSDSLIVEENNHQAISKYFKLYKLDLRTSDKVLTKLTEDNYSSERQPVSIATNIYTYLSDMNGIANRYIAKHDSAISYVDTTVHYEYFTKSYPVTNYKRNIESYDINADNLRQADILLEKSRYPMYDNVLNTKKPENGEPLPLTDYKKSYIKSIVVADSLNKQEQKRREALLKKKKEKLKKQPIVKPVILNPDSVDVDINNYVFELEKKQAHALDNPEDTIVKPSTVAKEDKFRMPEKRGYLTSFYPNYVVSQFDYSSLSYSYQPFTGSADGYFNPDLSGMFKFGIQDLFEDYKITGGFRLGLDLVSNEYLLCVEDISKRLDKELVYHRQNFKQYDADTTTKNISQMLSYALKYPFTEVSALKLTFTGRYDQKITTTYERTTLARPDVDKVWLSSKLEYIYDDSKNLGLNLYDGIRSKAWFEIYQQIPKSKSTMCVIGGDFRWYVPIHRNFIWASRLAASTSFGSSKLLYYLGGVDSWMNFSDVPTFDNSTQIKDNKNYAFQANATNMRGFSQNVRNGNTFCLLNTELRFPIIKYFINRPMSSEFWSNLQLMGFFDAGSAWSGWSPWSTENQYNDEVLVNNPLTVTVHHQQSPFVAGYGFGLRSKLMGYFIKADWAWGIENNMRLPKVFYLSIGFDF